MSRTVAIIGAGTDRRKFGNKSVRAHAAAAGWTVFPVHPTETVVEGLTVYKSIADLPVEKLDRISVYLPPAVTAKVAHEWTVKPVSEVWLNPGADGEVAITKLQELGLNAVCGCSIIDVGFSPSQFADV